MSGTQEGEELVLCSDEVCSKVEALRTRKRVCHDDTLF